MKQPPVTRPTQVNSRLSDFYSMAWDKARRAKLLADDGKREEALALYRSARLSANESFATGSAALRAEINLAIVKLGGTL
ncbi:MAG: hypothetical protein WC551_07830 [Patescibacteria group bacterium]